MNWIILLFFFEQMALAQVKSPVLEPLADIISDDYEAGPFLIYNCEKKHWVCVIEDNYTSCQNQRLADDKKEGVEHSCAPIGKFPTKKSCFQRVLYMTGQNYGDRFCLKQEWKEKGVE